MIQSVMLAAFGFIAASLLALLIAPAFWARAVRLTNERLRSALPVSEQEIRADKDLMRAEYALKVHQLEREVGNGRLAAHRQQIEINRRDIVIKRLTDSLSQTDASLVEHRNARSVLEQTVTERIPVLERALEEARQVLTARDTAINELQATAERQAAALEDGRAILTQRALEVQRLQALFQEASAQGRARSDSGPDILALRAEIESLRARLAERIAVIERLQGEAAVRPRVAAPAAVSVLPDDATPEQLHAQVSEQTAEIAQLRRELEAGPHRSVGDDVLAEDRALAARHLQDLETQLRTQGDEIVRLRAESEAVSRAQDPIANARVRESKVWLRSRIERLETELEHERDAAGRVRAELAAANERAARQGQQHRDELRRQGSRMSVPARDILLDASVPAEAALPAAPAAGPDTAPKRQPISSRARELQRVLQGHFGQTAGSAPANDAAAPSPGEPTVTTPTADAAADASADPTSDAASRGRLLDRLKSYEQA